MREIKQLPIYVMDYSEFNALIAEEYGSSEYDVVTCEEWTNDSEHTMPVDGDLLDFAQEEVNAWIEGRSNKTPSFGYLLNDLAAKSIVPIGDYLITVMW